MTFAQEKRELEAEVLAGAFRGPRHCAAVVESCQDWLWEGDLHPWIYTRIREGWDRAKEIPIPAVFVAALYELDGSERHKGRAGQFEAFTGLLAEMGRSPTLALRALANMARRDTIRRVCSSVLDAIDESKTEAEVVSLFEEAKTSALSALVDEDDLTDWAETAEERFDQYRVKDETKERFRLPLPLMQMATRGGLPVAGRVLMLMGDTNAGKSTLAAAVGYEASSSQHAVVLHVVTEELKVDLAARYDARHLRVDRGDLVDGQFSDKEDREFRAAFKDMRRGHVIFKVLPMGSSVHQIRPYIQRIRARYPLAPILVIIDSPDYLNSGNRRLELRHDIKAVYETMKSWTIDAALAPMSLVLTTQVSGKWEGKLPPATGASESRDKARIVDLSLAILEKGEADESAQERQFEMGINKNRIGKLKNCLLDVMGDLGTCLYREVSPIRYLSDVEKDKKRDRERDKEMKRGR